VTYLRFLGPAVALAVDSRGTWTILGGNRTYEQPANPHAAATHASVRFLKGLAHIGHLAVEHLSELATVSSSKPGPAKSLYVSELQAPKRPCSGLRTKLDELLSESKEPN
jgi:hypothetical protein